MSCPKIFLEPRLINHIAAEDTSLGPFLVPGTPQDTPSVPNSCHFQGANAIFVLTFGQGLGVKIVR